MRDDTDTVPGGRARGPWRRILMALRVVEMRLRFVAVLAATGLVIGYWDTLENTRDRWLRAMRPSERPPASAIEYFCPMHPQVVRRQLDPGGVLPKCPICGMPLSLRERGAGEAPPVPGRVQLTPERMVLGGVRTERVEPLPLVREVVTVGNVRIDEGRRAQVVSRTAGFVERLHVARTYEWVAQGQPLAEVYSPRVLAGVRELAADGGRVPGLSEGGRRRLALLGVEGDDTERMLRAGPSARRMVVRAPTAGHVIAKPIVLGSSVEAGAMLYELADLSVVWIEAEVFERDVALVTAGQTVEATVEAVAGRVFKASVALIHPHVDESMRTNTVRFELQNPGHVLRPGMAATVRLRTPLAEVEPFRSAARPGGTVLAVPEEAVIDTGTRRVVYVESVPGAFDARAVELGPRVGAHFPVIGGLEAGERVVARGAFVVDAESRLDPAVTATYVGATGGPTGEGERR